MTQHPARILICRSNPVAPDPRVEKVAAALAESGCQVQVVGWDRSASCPPRETTGLYEIHRIAIPAKYGTGIGNLPRLFNWQVKLSLWLFSHRSGFDILHACDFDTVLPCIFMKYFFRKKLVYDIFDFYPDHLRNTPLWIRQAIRRLDHWVIDHADAVILVDDSRREQIAGTHPKHLSVIYNSPEDLQIGDPQSTAPRQGRLRLAYIGLLQHERGLFEMLSVMKSHPEWTLDLAGFGGDEEAVREASSELSNVRWHGTVRYDAALEISSRADVLFATYDPAIPNHRYSSPNKLFEAMMLGKPVIVARDTNMDRVVSRHDCGLIVKYGDEADLERTLVRLANDPQLRKRLGESARKAYDTDFSWKIMKSRLLDLYTQIRR